MTIVKSVADKGDKAALIYLDDGSKAIWTPDRELARPLVGKPIPPDWVRKDGEYGPQAFPPKPKGQGRYRDTKEAFEAEAKSRAAWQQVEEERKDRRTALMQAGTATSDSLDIIEIADMFYEWLRSSPAAGPAVKAGVATTEPAEAPQAGGTSSAPGGQASGSVLLGEAGADTKPGEETFSASGKASPGFPIPPDKCDHKTSAGRWVKWRPLDYDDTKSPWICPKCGTPKLVAMESGGPYS